MHKGYIYYLKGNGAKLEFYSRLNFFPRENISVNVPLKPTDHWYDARTRRPVDKAAMVNLGGIIGDSNGMDGQMRVLADVDALWIRARYHQNQLQSSIYGLRMETASDAIGGEDHQKVHPVEICSCPEHFEGNSCERCEGGYRRVNEQLYDGQCKRCECQGHSQRCDPFTGDCLDCQVNK